MKLSLANLHHALARLAPRERMMVTIGGGVLAAFLVFLMVYETQKAKSSMRQKITAKERQLEKVQVLRSGAWQTIAALPAISAAGAWSAAGTALTAQIPEGTYSIRAVAVGSDGGTVSSTTAGTLSIVHSAPVV